jgi:hypothetical protein
MNILRVQWGQPVVSCVPQAELDEVIDQITANVEFKYLFFDPTYYHNNGQME